MELKLNVSHIGIDFLVHVKLDNTWKFEKVTKVRAWDENADKYKTIPCDLLAFEKGMQEQLLSAVEKIRRANKI